MREVCSSKHMSLHMQKTTTRRKGVSAVYYSCSCISDTLRTVTARRRRKRRNRRTIVCNSWRDSSRRSIGSLKKGGFLGFCEKVDIAADDPEREALSRSI